MVSKFSLLSVQVSLLSVYRLQSKCLNSLVNYITVPTMLFRKPHIMCHFLYIKKTGLNRLAIIDYGWSQFSSTMPQSFPLLRLQYCHLQWSANVGNQSHASSAALFPQSKLATFTLGFSFDSSRPIWSEPDRWDKHLRQLRV